MLLTQLGVDSLLVSALPTTSILPKAHVLNQRAMEILADVGVAGTIYDRGTPLENMRATAWYAGLTGPDPIYGRKIGQLDAWGGGYTDTDWVAASPCPSTNLPQIRLEPILKQRAEAMAPGKIRFHHEVVDLEQSESSAVATVVDRDSGEQYRIRAQYVLACDGGRTINKLVGVEMEGARQLMNAVSLHITADLSKWATDPEVLIRWLVLPSTGTFAVLVPMGPNRWGPDSEEWVYHINYQHADTRALDDAEVERDMREGLGIGDHPVEIHKISRWSLEGRRRVTLPGRADLHARRRCPSTPTDRRTRTEQRDSRRPQSMLESRRGDPRPGRPRSVVDLRTRTPTGGFAATSSGRSKTP